MKSLPSEAIHPQVFPPLLSVFSTKIFLLSRDEAVEAMEMVLGLFDCTSSEGPGHQLWFDLGVW